MSSLNITKNEVVLPLGDTSITVAVHQAGKGDYPTFLNVHDDEDTSVAAGLESLRARGGRLMEFTHGGERLIRFKVGGLEYQFDPNRIFSDLGITATLKRHSTYSEEAHLAIQKFASQYVSRFGLDREKVIIALHNTVDGIFCVHSFARGGEYASDAAETHIGESRNKFDFFYVTEPKHYKFLKEKQFNVVLQSTGVTEDGSLSVFFSAKKIPYVNIEARMGHLHEQIVMVETVRQMLDSVKL